MIGEKRNDTKLKSNRIRCTKSKTKPEKRMAQGDGGDCFHCGSEYINTGDNKRLFFKVMSQGHAISKEEEDQVNNMPMKCPLCSCPCRIQRAVSTHIRMKCDKASPDVITLREDRKRKQKEWDNKYKRKKT